MRILSLSLYWESTVKSSKKKASWEAAHLIACSFLGVISEEREID